MTDPQARKTSRRPRGAPLDHAPEGVTFARVKSGKSKQELAESLGISKQFMGDIEAGRRNADLELLKRMADVLDCPLVVLQAKRETTRERPGMSPAHKPVRGIAPAP